MYPWVESTHVITLMLSLGMLIVIDLRMLGLVLPDIPASLVAKKLNLPMLVGFSIMVITGLLLFYAIPVRTAQSFWFRIKVVLLIAAAVNAFLFHRAMKQSVSTWDNNRVAPARIRAGAILSLTFWVGIVICGRFIAYDWFDCKNEPAAIISFISGCLEGQTQF